MRSKEKPKEKHEAFRAPKGMHDVLPADEPYWEKIENAARSLARAYGFGRLEPPILETAALYNKTSGEESDVVEKEMYTLRTKGGDLLALRPEYTPGICRAYLEHGMSRLASAAEIVLFRPRIPPRPAAARALPAVHADRIRDSGRAERSHL